MVGRPPRQCYDHYYLHGESAKNQKHTWTDEELKTVSKFSSAHVCWEKFRTDFFPKLSISQLKNMHQRLRYLNSKRQKDNEKADNVAQYSDM